MMHSPETRRGIRLTGPPVVCRALLRTRSRQGRAVLPQGEANRDRGPRTFVALDGDRAPVRAHDLACPGQSQADAVDPSGDVGRAVEAVENARHVVGGDAEPVILDLEDRDVPVLREADADIAPVRTIFDGV